MCKPLPTYTTGHDNLNLIGLYMAEKALTGNNAPISAQMVHNQWLGKRFHHLMLPESTNSPCIIHHHALAVTKI
jgi:hypothetical protein